MEIRTLRASELDRAFDLDADAFHVPEERREAWCRFTDPARIVGAFEGDRLLAMTCVHELGQYFRGLPVPMGGLASVAVVPDARGRGLASQVIRRCLDEMRARGEAISTLFPATTGLYRSLGWELGGSYAIRRVDPQRLRSVPRPEAGTPRPLRDDDVPRVHACYDALARQHDGCLERRPHWWERRLHEWRDRDVYVFEGAGGEVEGYLAYRQVDGEYSHLGGDFAIAVDEIVANTRDAAQGLWRLLGDWAAQVEAVFVRGASEDPVLLVLPEQVFQPLAEVRWMTRVVDATAAVAARGFPTGLDLEVPLRLRDSLCDAHQGDFVLSVQKGRGVLTPATSGSSGRGAPPRRQRPREPLHRLGTQRGAGGGGPAGGRLAGGARCPGRGLRRAHALDARGVLALALRAPRYSVIQIGLLQAMPPSSWTART